MLVIIQARMSSQRLPGKVLRTLGCKPILRWVVDRIQASESSSEVVIATSIDPTDDPIVRYCSDSGIVCIRGPLNDVAGRLANVATQLGAPAFVRICADSPLVDPTLIDSAIRLYQALNVDLVTNVMPRTFPKGQSVEVINTSTFVNALKNNSQSSDREHVTTFYYADPTRYRIVNFTSGQSAGSIQLSIDTDADLRAIEGVLDQCPTLTEGWSQLMQVRETLNHGHD